MTFRTPEEAIERANNTPYGLSAGVWTDKGSKIFKIVNQTPCRSGLGQHLQQIRSVQSVRRLQGKRFGREGGRHGLLPYLSLG